ncbi:MAG: T9SS type A sorting domain-containing protein, partial [Candidatus Marinimicrobia bacterium]|nr:T9SS type A sorting domain-containing protein [Candidatus Neomarinimicrobiota bacterium]
LSDDNYDDPDILKNEIDYSSRTNCKEEEPSNIECLKIDPKSFSREDLYHTVYLKWYINENVWYTLNDNPTLEINVYDVNNAGNVTYANTLSIITSIEGGPDGSPGPPTLISVIYDQSANNIKLEYEPDLSEPYPEYCAIYRCPANENIDDSDQIGITSNNYEYYDDSGELIPGNEYKYAVAGVNVVGEGYNSNTKCAIFGEELENIISNNLSLDGSYYSNGTIVENGVTLDIDPGSEINFAPNASLEVNGTLDAQGTESEPIVFNSSVTWDGINLVNTSNSNLKYCEIKNASNGIFISDCDPDIEQCYIHNNTSDGINMINYASPYLYHNTISNNSGDGVYCYNYCNPTFTNNSSNPGYNEIKNNGNIGIIASGNSAPLLGISAAGQQVIGDNSIHGNSWADAVGASYSTISAEWCYWDGDPDSTTSGDVVYYNPLDDDPCDPGGGSGLAKSSIKFTNQDYFDPECVNENDPLELLQHALYNNSGAKYEEAVKTLKKLIKEFPNNGYSATGLGLLYKISRDKNNMDIASYCKDNILAKTSSDLLKQTSYEILISKAIRNKDNKTAIQYCQRILEKYPNTNSEAYALYNMCILFQDSNKETSEYLETMKNKYSNHPLTFYARSLLGENVEWSKAKQHQFERPKTAVAEAPETFEFLQPSPNPFNPTTNIRFALPEAAKVNISVYNILGEKVWTYKSNKFEAGYHSIAWHSIDNSGHRVSSGIYIIRIRSENQQATQKVMLMK